MFICRRCLLRANIPKRIPTPVFVRSNHTKTGHKRRERVYIPADRFPTFHPTPSDTTHDVTTHDHATATSDTPVPERWRIPITDEEKAERRRKYYHWRSHPIKHYTEQHKTNPDAILDTPFYALRWVIKDAILQGQSKVLEYITMDVVKRYVGRSHWERLWVLGKLLKSTRQGNTTLPKHCLLLVVETLDEEGYFPVMPPHVVGFAAKAVLRYAEDPKLDPKLIRLLTPHLFEQADKLRQGIITSQTEDLIRHLIWPLFSFVPKLLSLGLKEEALVFFRQLVEKKYITENSMQNIDLSSQDVTYIMVGTMVQACLDRGWHLQARNLLRQVVLSEDTVHPFLVEQLHNSTWWSLSRGLDSDFEFGHSIISVLLSKQIHPLIPDKLLSIYYKEAKARNAGDEAEHIYDLTTAPSLLKEHVYLPPQGPGLLWFLEHCVFNSKNFRIARNLADRVLAEDLQVPLQDKALVIAAVASVGWASHARDLWDRYTHQRGARYVFGNAHAMLRIVSLFNALIRRGEKKIETVRSMADQTEPEEPVPTSSDVLEKDAPPHAIPEVEHERDVDEEELTDLTEDLPEDELSDVDVPFLPKHYVRIDYFPETSNAKKTIELLEERLRDFRAFADHVIDKFASMHEPLKKADHHDLNALARAYFIVGRNGDGFNMFKLIIARRGVPDISDVNVALSAMAQQSPAQAASMIEKMVKYGLQPDAVSFGTIIHHAIMDRDLPLVAELIVRARELGVKQLTYKTMGSLIKATVSTLYEDEHTPEAQLDNAKDLVDSLLSAGFTPSIRMGLDCVVACLRADDPVMAFRFWKLFLKKKAHWDDLTQTRTRRRIANSLRLHRSNRWLNVEFANIMISELGEDPSLHTEVRRAGLRPVLQYGSSKVTLGRPQLKKDSNQPAESSVASEANTTKSTED